MRNSSYSFMPILLKLYRCFCHDLKICMWFGYYPEIIFCHFFCNLNLVIFKCTIMAGDINSLNLLVHFQFSFGTRTAHQEKIKSIYECIRTSNLPDLMYAQIIKYCLAYFCVALLRVLRIMTQNESCEIRQLYVVELAVFVLFLL